MSMNCQSAVETCGIYIYIPICGTYIYRTPLINIKGQIAYTCFSMDNSKSSCQPKDIHKDYIP